MHISVMQNEVLSFFQDRKLFSFVDATLGAGGHSKALLEAHPEIKTLYGLDQDPRALIIAKETLAQDAPRVQLIHANFDTMKEHVPAGVDGILMDIGVSSMQLDESERGFSFMKEGPLDMRMNPDEQTSAQWIVNRYSEREIARIILEYGEEKKAPKIAKAICEARRKKKIETTLQLAEIVESIIPRYGKTHPATTTFQALRIAVNRELERLAEVIPQALDLLAPQGRLAIITFHSLEDRIVKNAFRAASNGQILTKKPLIPTDEECRYNRRSRSAKLRVIEKRDTF